MRTSAQPAYSSTKAFVKVLRKKKIKYTYDGINRDSNNEILTVYYDTKYVSDLEVTFFFEKTCDNVALCCFDLVKIARLDRLLRIFINVNEMNQKFRYVKFCIDTSNYTIRLEMDAEFWNHDMEESRTDAGDNTIQPEADAASRKSDVEENRTDAGDNAIQPKADAASREIREINVGEICCHLLRRCADACNEAYPIFMKSIWD